MKYYWLVESAPEDWIVTNTLLELDAVHISTNAYGNQFIRRFLKQLSDEEVTLMKLQYSHRLDIYPISDKDYAHLKEQGYIKS